jgi:hypothetical protein
MPNYCVLKLKKAESEETIKNRSSYVLNDDEKNWKC